MSYDADSDSFCICEHHVNPWYQVNCEACGQPTPEFEPYKLRTWCENCGDSYNEWISMENQTFINGSYMILTKCNSVHTALVGPIIRNNPYFMHLPNDVFYLVPELGHCSNGIFIDCPNCNQISKPTSAKTFILEYYYDIEDDYADKLGFMNRVNEGSPIDNKDDIDSVTHLRCGLCGYADRFMEQNLIAPFQITLTCQSERCTDHDYQGIAQPSISWLDLFEKDYFGFGEYFRWEKRIQVNQIGFDGENTFYETKCQECSESLYFKCDLDIFNIETTPVDHPDRYFLTDNVWVRSVDIDNISLSFDYEVRNDGTLFIPSPPGYHMETNFDWRIDNYRRSTVVLEKQPKVLQQVFELPTFDFSKSNFQKGDFKKTDFSK